MTIQELFITANLALERSIVQVSDEQMSLDMPLGTSMKPATLGGSIRYHTYDDAWVPEVLAAKTKQEVGDAYEGLLTDDIDILAEYRAYNKRANSAVENFKDLEKMVHLSYGDFPAGEYLQHVTIFRAFRSYDIAKLIGANTKMDDTFVQAIIDEYSPVVEGYRQMGVFPAAIDVPANSDKQTKLLALVGRS